MATRREVLELLERELTGAVSDADPGNLAGLSRELRAVAAELDALPDPKRAAAPSDEIAQRREERRKKAAGE